MPVGQARRIVFLPGLQAARDAAEVARKIAALIAAPVLIDGHKVRVTASVGISLFPEDGADADALLRTADAAMYHSKKHSRSGCGLGGRCGERKRPS